MSTCTGTNKDEAGSPEILDGTSSIPKQLKFPNQVYIDLPRWKDEQALLGLGGEAGGGDSQDDPSTTSPPPASTTSHPTPTYRPKRALPRRRTDPRTRLVHI